MYCSASWPTGRGYASSTRRSPVSTAWPAALWTAVTVPPRSERSSFSIFMAPRTMTGGAGRARAARGSAAAARGGDPAVVERTVDGDRAIATVRRDDELALHEGRPIVRRGRVALPPGGVACYPRQSRATDPPRRCPAGA